MPSTNVAGLLLGSWQLYEDRMPEPVWTDEGTALSNCRSWLLGRADAVPHIHHKRADLLVAGSCQDSHF